MKEIKNIINDYVSYEELCDLSKKNRSYLVEYVIAEDQWYIKYRKKKKKIQKETIIKYFSDSKNNILENNSGIKNIFKKVS